MEEKFKYDRESQEKNRQVKEFNLQYIREQANKLQEQKT